MFGFSLTKLLFTIAVVIAVWQGFKWVGRVQALREAEARRVKAPGPRSPADPPSADAEEMVKCPVCGVYVSDRGMASCGRPDCPYPG